MDLNIINIANYFYQLRGFKYIDSPWLIDIEALNTTTPLNAERFKIKDKYIVASGEQSFIDMCIRKKLPPGRYCTTTPCFRDENEDETHKIYFLKTELIDTISVNPFSLNNIVNICAEFFKKYTTVEIVPTGDNAFDINDAKTGIELGSYGIRKYKDIEWVYATGVAEPRLSYVLSKNNKLGYHNTYIPKGIVGQFSKIVEEFEELKDAHLQNNNLLALCELADLYGAIDSYLTYNFPGITPEDLKKMSESTRRSFENGRR